MNNITLHSLMDKGSATSLLCRAVSLELEENVHFFSEELITYATDIIIPRNKQINFFSKGLPKRFGIECHSTIPVDRTA